MEDYIIRATAGNGSIRAFAAYTKKMVEDARKIHGTSPVATAALGRLLTAAAMMGCMLKSEKDLLTLQIKGDGPLRGIMATSDAKSNVKGYVYEPGASVPSKYPGKLDVSGAVGKGYLSVVKDIGMKEPYAGQIELVSGEIADDLTYYFTKSEQTPSSVGLGVLIDVDLSVKQAGGFLIQIMPDAQDGAIDLLEKNLQTLSPITKMLEDGLTPEAILETIFKGMELSVLEKTPTRFYCNCTRQRVEKALISIGLEELHKIADEDKEATLHCHFCNKEYHFDENELRALIREADGRNAE